MSMNACPACNAPIDPARAPVARVRDGRVVTFCSQACADAPLAGAASRAPEASRDQAGAAPGVAAVERDAGAKDTRPGSPVAGTARRGPRPRRSGRRRVIALSSAMLVGGMVITIINAVSPSTPVDVNAASQRAGEQQPSTAPAAARAADPAPAAAAPVAPEELYQRAQSTLRALMTSPSARVQRIAAMALARLGADAAPDAIERLGALLDQEASELGRIEIAYALARAGDARGKRLLVASLADDRRDVRLDAARALVRLGDDTGNRTLERMLRLRTHRLGVAGLLARRGDDEGMEVLREVLEDGDESREQIMRAAVSLGRAGDASVRDRLLEILDDGRYHVGAADALATLGDRAAVPALRRQLALSSLRVRAALGLRRLGETVALDELAAALDRGSEPARVSAAEAILILAGPRNLAELD